MPFEYTPVKKVEYGEYWAERNRERVEKTPKADMTQIPSWGEVYAGESAQAAQAAQAARQAEIDASPYAWHGEGMPSTPAQRAAWKQEFFKER